MMKLTRIGEAIKQMEAQLNELRLTLGSSNLSSSLGDLRRAEQLFGEAAAKLQEARNAVQKS